MKRSDEVFFFTLVDFLLQVVFFGLVVFVAIQISEAKRKADAKHEQKAVEQVLTWTGFSTLTELSDFLSRLAPPTDFKGWADFMARHPEQDPRSFESMLDGINRAGGWKTVQEAIEANKKALGLPPCPSTEQGDSLAPVPVAVLMLSDQGIVLASGGGEMRRLLQQLGMPGRERWSLSDFHSSVDTLRTLYPECRYFVDLEYEDANVGRRPLKVVGGAFRFGKW